MKKEPVGRGRSPRAEKAKKLSVKRETLKDLQAKDKERVKGGRLAISEGLTCVGNTCGITCVGLSCFINCNPVNR